MPNAKSIMHVGAVCNFISLLGCCARLTGLTTCNKCPLISKGVSSKGMNIRNVKEFMQHGS